jgi:uncharacterized protein YoaH (UPF0181 family)
MNRYNSVPDRGYSTHIPKQKFYNERPEQVVEKLPVEQRLNLYNEVYKTRRDERASEEIHRRTQEVSSPTINPASKRMIENKFAGVPLKRVEERLYDDHRKRQIIKDRQQKAIERRAIEMSNPNKNQNGLSTNNRKKIVSRLLDYKQKENTNIINKKFEDEECTFKPMINSTSRKYADQMINGMPFEFRNSNLYDSHNNKNKLYHADKN